MKIYIFNEEYRSFRWHFYPNARDAEELKDQAWEFVNTK
jgi:hypothetical protein